MDKALEDFLFFREFLKIIQISDFRFQISDFRFQTEALRPSDLEGGLWQMGSGLTFGGKTSWWRRAALLGRGLLRPG